VAFCYVVSSRMGSHRGRWEPINLLPREIMRGIIATAAQVNIQPNGFSVDTRNGGLSENDIKYFLLYWDKVIIPGNNFVYAEIPYEKDLIESNIIERPILSFQGSFSDSEIGKAMLHGESKIVEEKIKDKKIDWTIHQFNNQLILPDDKIIKKKVFKFELMNILPVPNDNVPIYDIIDFKQRRKDEFLALHNTLDELYFEILKSPDSDLKQLKTVKNLQEIINDIEKVQKEKFKLFTKYDLTTEININGKDILAGIVTGGIIDWQIGTKIPLVTILGSIGAMFKISIKKSNTFSALENKLNLAYLSKANKEKII